LYSDLFRSGYFPKVYWTGIETEKRHGGRSERSRMIVSGDPRNKAQKKEQAPESMPGIVLDHSKRR